MSRVDQRRPVRDAWRHLLPRDRPYTIVIAEKPRAAQKIAQALGAEKKVLIDGVPVYIARRDGREILIVPTAGHLFTLATEARGYPVYEYRWVPRHLVEKGYEHLARFYRVFSELMRGASEYINACDYDIEGSVIGYMIIREWGDVSRAKRMKFSTLTREDILKSFNSLEPLDMNMVEAGIARHELDWIWGINISRALTDLYSRRYGRRRIISAGRVQTPTLYETMSRYVERETFVPAPIYRLSLKAVYRDTVIEFEDEGEPIKTRAEAQSLRERILREGFIEIRDYDERVVEHPPPHPFNLGDIQSEAYQLYRLSPSETLDILEDLYLEGLISYPRTNSQRLPRTLDHRSVLTGLMRGGLYRDYIRRLLEKRVLVPNNGKKEDPAHPAIYPTGETPSRRLGDKHAKIYDLVVRRYLATLSDSLYTEEVSVRGCVSGRCFRTSGRRILRRGWLEIYGFYSIEERGVPRVSPGTRIPVREVRVVKTYTRPVRLYNKATLLRWMERENIGTESTRAEIIDTLFKRGYVSGREIRLSRLGLEVLAIVSEYFPELISTELTRRFENMLRDIIERRTRREDVVREAVSVVGSLIERFKREVIENSPGTDSRPRCVICGMERSRESVHGFCWIHERAYRNLVETYNSWRLDGLDWETYLEKVYKSRLTGSYVKEVIEYLRRSGVS